MGDTEEVPTVAETVAEQPAEVVSKETITEAEADAVAAEADNVDLPLIESKGTNGNEAEAAPKENGTAKEENGAENGRPADETEERKRKTDEVESLEDAAAEVSAEKKAKLEEKSEAKQDEGVENPSNGEAEVAA